MSTESQPKPAQPQQPHDGGVFAGRSSDQYQDRSDEYRLRAEAAEAKVLAAEGRELAAFRALADKDAELKELKSALKSEHTLVEDMSKALQKKDKELEELKSKLAAKDTREDRNLATATQQMSLKGSRQESTTGRKGNPLLDACSKGNLSDVKKHLNYKDINSADNAGWTPLHHAAAKGNFEIVKLLISKGSAISAETWDGKTPLALARQQNHTAICKWLTDNHGGLAGK